MNTSKRLIVSIKLIECILAMYSSMMTFLNELFQRLFTNSIAPIYEEEKIDAVPSRFHVLRFFPRWNQKVLYHRKLYEMIALLICLFLSTYSTESDLTFLRSFNSTSVYREVEHGTIVIKSGTVRYFELELTSFSMYRSIFCGVGYAHATDRLWQIFIRFVTANGRMSEFFGRGENDVNLESDKMVRKMDSCCLYSYNVLMISSHFIRLTQRCTILKK